jgi:flagellar assembly protein FliH
VRWKRREKSLSVEAEKNMKLSSDLGRNSGGQGNIQAWMPVEFSRPVKSGQPSRAKEIATIQEIFQPLAKNVDGSSQENQAWVGKAVLPWSPVDIRALVSKPEEVRAVEEMAVAVVVEEEIQVDPMVLAQEEAQRILENARHQAEEILQLANQQKQQIFDQSYQEGQEAARNDMQQTLDAAKAVVDQASNWWEKMLVQSEPTVLALVREMGQCLFGQGFVLDQQGLQETYTRAIQKCGSLGDLQIFIHPEDAAHLDPYWREYYAAISGRQVQMVPAESIQRGGCYIQGQLGSVDARIETQMKAIMETLSSPVVEEMA